MNRQLLLSSARKVLSVSVITAGVFSIVLEPTVTFAGPRSADRGNSDKQAPSPAPQQPAPAPAPQPSRQPAQPQPAPAPAQPQQQRPANPERQNQPRRAAPESRPNNPPAQFNRPQQPAQNRGFGRRSPDQAPSRQQPDAPRARPIAPDQRPGNNAPTAGRPVAPARRPPNYQSPPQRPVQAPGLVRPEQLPGKSPSLGKPDQPRMPNRPLPGTGNFSRPSRPAPPNYNPPANLYPRNRDYLRSPRPIQPPVRRLPPPRYIRPCPPPAVIVPCPVYRPYYRWPSYWWYPSIVISTPPVLWTSYTVYSDPPPVVQYITQETTVIKEVPVQSPAPAIAAETLNFPGAKIVIMYRDIVRSTVVGDIVSVPATQPVAWQKQTFSPGPTVQWECNPVVTGRDSYEFWITNDRTGFFEKADVIYYGNMTVVWSDDDLLITIE